AAPHLCTARARDRRLPRHSLSAPRVRRPPLAPRGEFFGEPELLHLPRARDGKLLAAHHLDLDGHLVGGERVLAQGPEGFRIDGVAGLRHDDGNQDLFFARIRYTYYVSLLHRRVAEKHLLDLERSHVDPARLHHLLDTSSEPQAAVVAHEAEIPGDEKALGIEGRRVLLRIAIVARREISTHEDLAPFARGERLPRLPIDDADLHAGQRKPHRGASDLRGVVRVGDRAVAVALGEPVDVADLGDAQVHHHLHGRG